MKPKEIYNNIYKKLNYVTPINADCGKLCDKACCKGDDQTGMYLFPFEEVMFKNSDDFKILKTDFASLLICKGKCNRNLRPLSCRIFPLIPYINENGVLSIIMDKRAVNICPLAFALDINDLNYNFINKVNEAANFLIKFKEIKDFIYKLSIYY